MVSYPVNATLVFKVPASGGVVTRDPVTGRPVQATDVITIQASLEDVVSANTKAQPGVDAEILILEGRAVEPKSLPASIKPQMICDLTLQRTPEQTQSGKFRLLPVAASRLGLERYFGDFLSGEFTPNQGGA